jgi:hypothetical protein
MTLFSHRTLLVRQISPSSVILPPPIKPYVTILPSPKTLNKIFSPGRLGRAHDPRPMDPPLVCTKIYLFVSFTIICSTQRVKQLEQSPLLGSLAEQNALSQAHTNY